MPKARPEFEQFWLAALKEEFGIKLVVPETQIQLVMNDLYATRERMNNPALAEIRICQMKEGLWLVKKEVELKEVELPDG